MKRLFAFLACCLPIYLFAQGFGSFSHDQPFFAKDRSSVTPDDLPLFGHLKYRWKLSSVTNTPVNIWIDEVQTNCMVATNGSPYGIPTTNSHGIYFPNSGAVMFMTNVVIDYSTDSFCIVLDAPAVADGNNNAHVLVNDANNQVFQLTAPDGSGRSQIRYISSGTFDITGQGANGISSNSIVDVFTIGYSTSVNNTWTNGVSSQTYWPPAIWAPSMMGYHIGVGQIYHGGIKEIIVWAATNFSATAISNVHYYCTNTYGGYP